MNFPQRQLADRRTDALASWRGLERREAHRRAIDNARANRICALVYEAHQRGQQARTMPEKEAK